MRAALAATATAFLPALAVADPVCEAAGDDAATLDGLGGEDRLADDALHRIWPRVLAEAPSGGDPEMHRHQAIRAAQRAWTGFRDADCAAARTVGIPRHLEMNRLRCAMEHTRARTAALTGTYLD